MESGLYYPSKEEMYNCEKLNKPCYYGICSECIVLRKSTEEVKNVKSKEVKKKAT